QFVAAICVRVRDRMQNSRKSRTSHCIFRREICASEKWAPVWSEKSCERPSTLSGNCAYSGLISRVHIGTFIAINFYGNKKTVDNLGGSRIFVALAIHNVTTVAPHRSNIQQDWFVLRASAGESIFAPFVPAHRLMRCRTKIRTCGLREAAAT